MPFQLLVLTIQGMKNRWCIHSVYIDHLVPGPPTLFHVLQLQLPKRYLEYIPQISQQSLFHWLPTLLQLDPNRISRHPHHARGGPNIIQCNTNMSTIMFGIIYYTRRHRRRLMFISYMVMAMHIRSDSVIQYVHKLPIWLCLVSHRQTFYCVSILFLNTPIFTFQIHNTTISSIQSMRPFCCINNNCTICPSPWSFVQVTVCCQHMFPTPFTVISAVHQLFGKHRYDRVDASSTTASLYVHTAPL